MQSFLLDFGFCFISRLGPSGIPDSLQTTAAWSAHGKRVFSHGQLGAMCVAAGSIHEPCLMRLMRLQVVVLLLVDILLLPVPFTRVVLHDHSWAQVWLQSMLCIIV